MKISSSIGLVVLALGGLNSVVAQEPQVAEIQVLSLGTGGDDEGAVQSRIAEGAASFALAAPSGNMFSFGRSVGGVDPNNRSQLFHLLSNESIRRELKLTEEQYGGAKQIMKEAQQRMQTLIQSRMSQSKGGRRSVSLAGGELRDLMEENQAQAEAALEEILLPEQMERIRQLAYQVEVSQDGLGESLVHGRLGTEIGVHDDQKQHLLDKAAQLEAEARLEIARIRMEMRAKLFAELTPEQRKAAEALLGDYFEYEEPSLSQQLRKRIRGMRDSADSEEKPE